MLFIYRTLFQFVFFPYCTLVLTLGSESALRNKFSDDSDNDDVNVKKKNIIRSHRSLVITHFLSVFIHLVAFLLLGLNTLARWRCSKSIEANKNVVSRTILLYFEVLSAKLSTVLFRFW